MDKELKYSILPILGHMGWEIKDKKLSKIYDCIGYVACKCYVINQNESENEIVFAARQIIDENNDEIIFKVIKPIIIEKCLNLHTTSFLYEDYNKASKKAAEINEKYFISQLENKNMNKEDTEELNKSLTYLKNIEAFLNKLTEEELSMENQNKNLKLENKE